MVIKHRPESYEHTVSPAAGTKGDRLNHKAPNRRLGEWPSAGLKPLSTTDHFAAETYRMNH